MRAELKSLLQETETTTIYVTHDQVEAMSLADRIAVMHGGEIVQYATPTEVYAQSGDDLRRRLHRQPADELPDDFRVTLGARALGATPPNGAAQLGIRPEDIVRWRQR